MEQRVALKKLGKMLGPKLGYRIDPKAPTGEERDAARAQLSAAVSARNDLTSKRDTRRDAILAADEEFQRLRREASAAIDTVEKLGGMMRHRKITVGVSTSLFFVVKAEGDNWQEVVDKVVSAQREKC